LIADMQPKLQHSILAVQLGRILYRCARNRTWARGSRRLRERASGQKQKKAAYKTTTTHRRNSRFPTNSRTDHFAGLACLNVCGSSLEMTVKFSCDEK
jgi:hypothetical protein